MNALAVIDTNVWVSGLFWKGTPSKIIHQVNKGLLIPCFSEITFAELDKTITKITQNLDSFNIYLHYRKRLLKYAFFVYPKDRVIICRDAKDNCLLEVAQASGANFLISGDKDLLVVKKFKKTIIISPKKYLQENIKK